ncbi:hypothetical protein AB5J55_35145 [Streptomyces sp. R11]|uniref:Helix-turn-helix domain-containing protein n=1 Tax=Streptomyces sp. R11 TaxID=3238625 RepID=A0AB39N984_9ACTN
MDAMHWVWNHSQSKGNARIALLYVADQVRTSACEVRAGQRELMRALNTRSKDTVEKAIKAAVESGDLEIAAPAAGRRPALYRLPKAVGYMRPATACAPESGAQSDTAANRCAPENGAQAPASSPDSGAQSSEADPACAPESGAQETRCAPESGAPPQHYVVEEESQQRRDAFTICQPLIKALTEAGITVSWGMPPEDLKRVAAAVERAGIPAMVRFALDTQRTRRDRILYARYFVRGWTGLPPAAAGPKSSGPQPHCGHADCDPVTRTRETEDDRGLRRVHPCPECHPTAQKGHAA